MDQRPRLARFDPPHAVLCAVIDDVAVGRERVHAVAGLGDVRAQGLPGRAAVAAAPQGIFTVAHRQVERAVGALAKARRVAAHERARPLFRTKEQASRRRGQRVPAGGIHNDVRIPDRRNLIPGRAVVEALVTKTGGRKTKRAGDIDSMPTGLGFP